MPHIGAQRKLFLLPSCKANQLFPVDMRFAHDTFRLVPYVIDAIGDGDAALHSMSFVTMDIQEEKASCFVWGKLKSHGAELKFAKRFRYKSGVVQ